MTTKMDQPGSQIEPARHSPLRHHPPRLAESVGEILAVLNSNRPLPEILNFIVSQAAGLLHADAVAIYRLLPNASLLTIQSSVGLDANYIQKANIPLGQAATGQATLTRQPVLIADVAHIASGESAPSNAGVPLDPALAPLLLDLANRYRAVLSVPLIIKDDVYGALTLYYRKPQAITGRETEMAISFCDQAALAIENARLRAEIEQTAAAAERSRLARELHDSVTQTLFSTNLIAEVLPEVWRRNPTEANQALQELRMLTRGALAEMRTLLLELRPAALEQARLEDLLRQLTEAASGRARIPIQATFHPVGLLPLEVKLALYRIAQESLNNIIRHANAHSAQVSLQGFSVEDPDRQTAAAVILTIADDGCGFQEAQPGGNHFGLVSMRERALQIGARLAITSPAGCGTQVSVTWNTDNR